MDSTVTQDTALPHNDCLTDATMEVFGATCGLGLAQGPDDEVQGSDGMIVAVISLVGDVEWSVFLGLPRSTASAVAAKFAGFEIPFDSSDMGDAVGELTNILAGSVKARLDQRGVRADISLPTVFRAQDLQVLIHHGKAMIRTCFTCDAGKLWSGVVAGKCNAVSAS